MPVFHPCIKRKRFFFFFFFFFFFYDLRAKTENPEKYNPLKTFNMLTIQKNQISISNN